MTANKKFGEGSCDLRISGTKDLLDCVDALNFDKKDGNYRLTLDFEIKDQKISRLFELKIIHVGCDELRGTLETINKETYPKYDCNFVEPDVEYPESDEEHEKYNSVTIIHIKNGIEASKYFDEEFNSGC